jgi:hypothetical protein
MFSLGVLYELYVVVTMFILSTLVYDQSELLLDCCRHHTNNEGFALLFTLEGF